MKTWILTWILAAALALVAPILTGQEKSKGPEALENLKYRTCSTRT